MNWGSNWGFTDLNRDSPFWIHQFLFLELHFAGVSLFVGAGQGFTYHGTMGTSISWDSR